MAQALADSQEVLSTVRRLAELIAEKISDPSRVAFIGIHTHGVPLARRLRALFDERHGTVSPFGTLDINLYRDDYDLRGVKPRIQSSEIRFTIDGLEVVLVDDVLFTGRTIRSAIEALGDYGRPSAIRLVVLADRGHRELPIQPDVTGFLFQTKKDDRIQVKMSELEGTDEIVLHPSGNKR